jgi:hypothetical protein
MDEKVYHMVAKNIPFSKIIVQGKGKIGKKLDSIRPWTVMNQPFDMIPGKNFDLDIWIVDNIGQIIKDERNRKGIGVGDESYPCDQPEGNEMSKKRSGIPLLWGCFSLLGKRWIFLRLGHIILFFPFFLNSDVSL